MHRMAKLPLRLVSIFQTRLPSMARDDTKLGYFSGWDIDQLFIENLVTVAIGTTAIYTIPASLPTIPVFEVLFRVSGFSRFYQAGIFSTDGTLAGTHNFSSYISGGQIFITTSVAGTAKYLVWTDKVDY